MPRGPKGERRPADVIGNAVHVMRVLTGEIEDKTSPAPGRAKGGAIGGKRRAEKLSTEQKREISKRASAARWPKDD